MQSSRRVKRQLLRGVIDENIETISGQPLGTLRRQRQRRLKTLIRAFVSAAAVALVAASVMAWFSGTRADSPPGPSVRVKPGIRSSVPRAENRIAPMEQVAQALSNQDPQELIRQVLPLHIQRIAVDPGHGGRDGGTSLEFGLLEKDITRDVANRLGRLLEEAGIEVVLTREDDDAVSLKERAQRANLADADLFISIHVNWLPNRNARGVETYYLGTTDDPFLNRLAAAENRDSGFALTDLRHLLDGIYADVRQAESRQFAEAIQSSLFTSLKEANDQIISRGVMTAPFVVLVATEMPAVLAEVACLSNAHEARLLAIPEYRQRIAEALYHGIAGYGRALSQTTETLTAEKGTPHEQGKQGKL